MKKIVITVILIIILLVSYWIYIQILNVETFKPEFPKEYDEMVIRGGEKQLIIKRSEMIDDFISKSKRVSEHVGEGLDFFILEFYLNDEKVYSIIYDDIGYPKGAIEVMNKIMEEYGIDMLDRP
jgi:hypothetical protein